MNRLQFYIVFILLFYILFRINDNLQQIRSSVNYTLADYLLNIENILDDMQTIQERKEQRYQLENPDPLGLFENEDYKSKQNPDIEKYYEPTNRWELVE